MSLKMSKKGGAPKIVFVSVKERKNMLAPEAAAWREGGFLSQAKWNPLILYLFLFLFLFDFFSFFNLKKERKK